MFLDDGGGEEGGGAETLARKEVRLEKAREVVSETFTGPGGLGQVGVHTDLGTVALSTPVRSTGRTVNLEREGREDL